MTTVRRIRIKKEKFRFLKDVQRIQLILIDKGFFSTLEECDELWRMYSEDHYCAGWVSMDGSSDQEIYDCVRPYFDPIDNPPLDTKFI